MADEYLDREWSSSDTDAIDEAPEEFFEELSDSPELTQEDPIPTEEDFQYDPLLDDISKEVTGLLALGKLNEKITVYGHDILIKTLKIGEELEAGFISDKYRETNEAGRAYATAIVAACVERVDGRPLVVALGPSEDSLLERKYEYVRTNWYWPVIRQIYEEYVKLLRKQNEALDELIKK